MAGRRQGRGSREAQQAALAPGDHRQDSREAAWDPVAPTSEPGGVPFLPSSQHLCLDSPA